jgi:Putative beta barrel porin-7 (BBP7)
MKNGLRSWGLAFAFCGWAAPVFAQQASPATSPQAGVTAPAATQAPPAGSNALPDGVLPPPTPEGQPLLPPPGGGVEPARFYFYTEYLLWWLRQDKLPVVASTSTNPFDNGILGQPTTRALFGGDGIDGGSRSGVAIGGGLWIDDCCKQDWIGFRAFYLSPQSTDFAANSNEFPTLARPFFNLNQGIEFAEVTAFPGRFTGALGVSQTSNLYGAELNAGCVTCCGCNYNFGFFGGFRFLELEESIDFVEDFHGLPTAPAPYTNATVIGQDFFQTRNQFYGGQVGVYGEYDYKQLSFEACAQIAVGDTHQSLLIDGEQVVAAPNGTITRFPGDLYALPSNIGRYHRERFSVVPEVGFNVGFLVTEHLRLFIGYDFLYWTNVIRPGTQIDRNLDITEIPNFAVPGVKPLGIAQPTAPLNSTDLWAQGMTLGFELRF